MHNQRGDTSGSRLLGREEAAGYLAIATRSLSRLVEKHVIAPVQIPGVRRVLFDRQDLDALVESTKADAGAFGEEPRGP